MEKAYYQILVETSKKRSILVFWIRDKILASSQDELNQVLRKEIPLLKSYAPFNKIIGMEITHDKFKETEKYYEIHNMRKDYVVIDDVHK